MNQQAGQVSRSRTIRRVLTGIPTFLRVLFGLLKRLLAKPWMNVGAILQFALLGFIVIIGINVFQDPAITIKAISVPKSLTDDGYTPEVASERLRDALNAYVVTSRTQKLIHIWLGTDQPDIVVPTVGLSIDTIASWIRTLLKLDPPNYLSGEITTVAGKLWLRLRLKDKEIYQRDWCRFGQAG
jgi:hypothetical protein